VYTHIHNRDVFTHIHNMDECIYNSTQETPMEEEDACTPTYTIWMCLHTYVRNIHNMDECIYNSSQETPMEEEDACTPTYTIWMSVYTIVPKGPGWTRGGESQGLCHYTLPRQKRPSIEAKETWYRGKRDFILYVETRGGESQGLCHCTFVASCNYINPGNLY
jgi:hypothetical protein